MRLRDFAQNAASRCTAEVVGGRYRLDGMLGSGGAAYVHRGFDLRLRRPVAVKVFRPDAGVDFEESLHNEAVMLARLDHPGLVTAYDTGQHDGRAFLVMRLIDGDNLRKRIAEEPLLPGATASVGAGVARALDHAHGAGIVHRDVKPSNIVLDAARRPHLIDFGISRMLDETSRTTSGTLVGTAAYLAPEQVLGRPVGRAADVYALGLVLLECLTGRLEYDGIPLEAAIARLHRAPVLPPGLPGGLGSLLRDMTSLDEQDRPTARDCARALSALADEERTVLAPEAPATSLVAAGRGAPRTAEHTHRSPAPAGAGSTRRMPPVRGRLALAGVAAALAAVAVTAFAATGASAPGGDGRSASSASDTPAAEQTEQTEQAERSENGTAASAGGGAVDTASPAASSPRPDAPVDVWADASGGALPEPMGSTGPPVTPERGVPDGTAATQDAGASATPHLPPGLAKKAAGDTADHPGRDRSGCVPACGPRP
ncbi:serine/threonine-protein kinase [uncultured Streptomyces sp.]|uniref:serine/threonine-protein kinase n=1 Tax=uncultured Streptomyces sp. TaxID=174707 RepID=UPI00261E386A|nr:serine/threonine-protein kinase [uncultured Streptomyces sp.]